MKKAETSGIEFPPQADRNVAEAVFEDVSKIHASASGDIEALEGLSFTIAPGESVALMGPSGCGKSTAINLLAGHDNPSSGRIIFQGRPVAGPDRRRGIMFQEDSLLPFRRVIDNVALGAEIAAIQAAGHVRRLGAELRALAAMGGRGWIDHGADNAEKDRLLEVLASVGMAEFAEKWPRELSGGMRKRVELARVLAQGPRLIALDEPFSNLDAFAREDLQNLVETLWLRSRCTLLTVTHDWLEATRLADRILVMSHRPGRIHTSIAVDLPRPRSREIVRSPEFARLAQLVHDAITDIAEGNRTPEEASR